MKGECAKCKRAAVWSLTLPATVLKVCTPCFAVLIAAGVEIPEAHLLWTERKPKEKSI